MILNTPFEVVLMSLFGGMMPALIWLLFWLKEDKKRPEPRGLIMLTFLGGMIAVPLVIPFQNWTQMTGNVFLTMLFWASFEEIFKLGSAYITSLRRREDNEPIDPVIYMMTTALGFAAAENALYLFTPMLHGEYTEWLITGNVRFIGASLLHTISSATIGMSMGFSFYKSKAIKRLSLIAGIFIAIALHTTFNLFIIRENSGTTFATLGFVWIAIVVLMLFFERIKRVYAVNKIQ